MYHAPLLSLALLLAWLVPSPAARAQAAAGDTPVLLARGSGPTGIMLADKKKKKKKKKKSEDGGEGFGPDGVEAITSDTADQGAGVHREQEGVDTPYKAEAAMYTSLSFMTVTAGEADPVDQTDIDISVEWLAILGSMGIGPDIRYSSSTSAVQTEVPDGTSGKTKTETIETKDSAYQLGGIFKWYFGNVDKADLLPFAYGGIAYRASESKTGEADAVKATGTVIRVGGGMNLFIDSNIAFNPRGEYYMATDKGDGEDAVETTTSGLKIMVGIAVFI